jgi:phosphate transport system protein
MATKHIVKSYDDELNRLTRKIIEMGGFVERQIADAIEALVTRDTDLAQATIERDTHVNALEEEIDHLAIRLLALRQPMGVDLRVIAMALKISNDLERMGDYAQNVAKRAIILSEGKPVKPVYAIPRMAQIAQAMVKDILDAYVERDADKAVAVWHRDTELDEMYNGLFRELLTYMLEDARHITPCAHLLFIAKNLERIGDHATNIAEKIDYMIHGQQINLMGVGGRTEPRPALAKESVLRSASPPPPHET